MPAMAASTFAVVFVMERISFFTKNLLPRILAPLGAVNVALGRLRPGFRAKIPRYSRATAWLRGWLPRERNHPRIQRPNIDLDAISIDVRMDVEAATLGNGVGWKDSKTSRAHTT
jgi:hypothetical protein